MQKTEEQVELEKQYYQLCADAGQRQYHIDCLQAEIAEINVKLRNINTRVFKLTKGQTEATEPTPTAETTIQEVANEVH